MRNTTQRIQSVTRTVIRTVFFFIFLLWLLLQLHVKRDSVTQRVHSYPACKDYKLNLIPIIHADTMVKPYLAFAFILLTAFTVPHISASGNSNLPEVTGFTTHPPTLLQHPVRLLERLLSGPSDDPQHRRKCVH